MLVKKVLKISSPAEKHIPASLSDVKDFFVLMHGSKETFLTK